MPAELAERTVIDQGKMVRQLEARIRVTKNERHRRNLEVVRAHLDAERNMDFDGVMKTVARNAEYKSWVAGENRGVKGWDAIRQQYIGALKAGYTVMEFDIETIVVDDDTVVTEGYQYQIAPPSYARACGLDSVDEEAVYLHRFRQTILWHIDADGLIGSENFYYSGGTSGFRKLAPKEIPAQYYRQFEMAKLPQFAGAGVSLDHLGSLVAGTKAKPA